VSEATSTAQKASLEVLNSAQQGIRVEFRWTGDRFSQSFFGVEQGQSELLLESIEGHAEDSCPQSPTLVELHQQDEAIFLTGACAVGHWSMCIEPHRVGEEVGLKFDVACRIKSPAERLTSSYRIAESVSSSHRDSSMTLSTAVGDFRLETLKLPATEEPSSCQLALVGNEMQLIREIHQADALPQTVRWQYRLIR